MKANAIKGMELSRSTKKVLKIVILIGTLHNEQSNQIILQTEQYVCGGTTR
jgi:hypothetical protein